MANIILMRETERERERQRERESDFLVSVARVKSIV